MSEPRQTILDCDPGHDDAVAMMLALANPAIELLGITTVGGNQTLGKITPQRPERAGDVRSRRRAGICRVCPSQPDRRRTHTPCASSSTR